MSIPAAKHLIAEIVTLRPHMAAADDLLRQLAAQIDTASDAEIEAIFEPGSARPDTDLKRLAGVVDAIAQTALLQYDLLSKLNRRGNALYRTPMEYAN